MKPILYDNQTVLSLDCPTHKRELNNQILPEVDRLVQSVFFRTAVQSLGFEPNESVRLRIEKECIQIKKAGGEWTIFDFNGDSTQNLSTSIVEKADAIWQRHLNECVEVPLQRNTPASKKTPSNPSTPAEDLSPLLQDATKKIHDQTAQIEQLTKKLQQNDEHLQNLQFENQSLLATIERLQSTPPPAPPVPPETRHRSTSTTQVPNSSQQTQTEIENVSNVAENVQDFNAEIDLLKDKLEQNNNRFKELESQNQSLQDALQRLQNTPPKEEINSADYYETIRKQDESTIKNLQKELSFLRQDFSMMQDQLENDLQEAHAKKQGAENERNELQNKLSSLEEASEKLFAAYEQTRSLNQNLGNLNTELERDIIALKAKLKEAQATPKPPQSQDSTQETALRRQLLLLQKQNQQLTSTQQSNQAFIDSLQEQVNTLNQTLANLRRQLSEQERRQEKREEEQEFARIELERQLTKANQKRQVSIDASEQRSLETKEIATQTEDDTLPKQEEAPSTPVSTRSTTPVSSLTTSQISIEGDLSMSQVRHNIDQMYAAIKNSDSEILIGTQLEKRFRANLALLKESISIELNKQNPTSPFIDLSSIEHKKFDEARRLIKINDPSTKTNGSTNYATWEIDKFPDVFKFIKFLSKKTSGLAPDSQAITHALKEILSNESLPVWAAQLQAFIVLIQKLEKTAAKDSKGQFVQDSVRKLVEKKNQMVKLRDSLENLFEGISSRVK